MDNSSEKDRPRTGMDSFFANDKLINKTSTLPIVQVVFLCPCDASQGPLGRRASIKKMSLSDYLLASLWHFLD